MRLQLKTDLKSIRLTYIAVLGACFLAALACSSEPKASPTAACGIGSEKCECYSDESCNKGLSCLSGLCVKEKAATKDAGTSIDAATTPENDSDAEDAGGNTATSTPSGTNKPATPSATATPSTTTTGGGGSATQKELSDGSVGSSCGTCSQGLTCITGVPNGFCSKACITDTDCGASGTCLETPSGSICYRSCKADVDCRPKYACASDGEVSVCDVATATTTPNSAGGGTCADSCIHYLTCKGVADTATYQSCLSNCNASGYTPEFLAEFQLTDCATAIQLVEGPSSSGSGGGSGGSGVDCNGCQWDGSSCVYLSQYTLVSTAGFACDASCC